MLDIFIWVVIIALFILSFVGVVFPIVPSVFVLWIGFLLYHFVLNADQLSLSFWIFMGVFTVILIGADIIANSYFVRKFGGSKWGERGAAIAVIIGSFITPPFGIIYVPFIAVFLIERSQQRTTRDAFRASIGSLIGFLGGTVAKVVVQFTMIVWFFIVLLF
ncbi:uncharacterized protein YqgC (DUF456 family) [Virgibacillus natechei]|uniref:Uncharacterized protein YqgC (DUF456 family) n=1 Tax=Virgibacillus natechei TaxID=1216297 RepID=A0ABS4ICH0_9BACI|nr:DUF456 domain-containing protein [Virgibacillus natechei]MBP1968608.1 uncharacterized protein YqgC (DUF456 family) [Virgibacillus natechei]UZD13717.1 DUF456 domain-containing protein [Virgibacillus natechei]